MTRHSAPQQPVSSPGVTGRSSIPETCVGELVLTTSAAAYWMPRSSRGMTAEIEAAAMPDQGATHQIATLVREFAGAPLQTGNDTSIKRTSFNRTGRDLHDFVAFADRTPAFDVLVRYVGGLLEASSARFDRVTSPDLSTSQVKISCE